MCFYKAVEVVSRLLLIDCFTVFPSNPTPGDIQSDLFFFFFFLNVTVLIKHFRTFSFYFPSSDLGTVCSRNLRDSTLGHYNPL